MSIVTPIHDQPITVPIEALSPEGFRRWSASPEFPQHARITRVDDGILIEGAVVDAAGQDFSVRIPASAGTSAGFSDWACSDDFPERGRLSFLQQEILIDMSPEELYKHNTVKMEIYWGLEHVIREGDLGRLFGDGALLRCDDVQLSTVPDGLFATWQTLQSGRLEHVQRTGHADEGTDLIGTPDWVLEVVSRSSVRKDKHRLRELYHRAGVAEYWLIDALGSEIDFQILVHQPDGYMPARADGGWQESPVFGRRFRLLREHDRLGGWKYRLESVEC